MSSLKKENISLKSQLASYKSDETNDTSDSSTDDDDSDSEDTASSDEVYGLGDEVGFSSDDAAKALGLTITAADQNWNAFATEQGDDIFEGKRANTVQLQVKYTNYGMSDAYLPDSDEITVYDDEGNAATPLSYQDGQTEVTKGHSGTTTLWYVFNKAFSGIKKFTIEYVPESDALATWAVTK